MHNYNSYMEISLANLMDNITYLQKEAGSECKVIPVLKGNAYGHGDAYIAKEIENELSVNMIGLAHTIEARRIRSAGYSGGIMLFACVPFKAMRHAVELKTIIPISSVEEAEYLRVCADEQGLKYVQIQLAVDTGLHRMGAQPGEEFDNVLKYVKTHGNLHVEGIYTHFADAEIKNSKYAQSQHEKFLSALEQAQGYNINPRFVHESNSAATEWFKDARFNAVRIGRRLYMDNRDLIYSGVSCDKLPIKEVASFRSEIVNIKTLSAGQRAGYNVNYKTTRTSRIAIVCAGYCDGVQKKFVENNVPVLVNNDKAKYVGVCMDQTLLDVTDVDCKIGDEVTFFGRSRDNVMLSSQYVGEMINEEGVYLTSMLTDRVQRVYV